MRISDWSSDVCSSDLVSIFPGAEVCPCDTTGRVTPDRVHGMLSSIRDRFPALRNIAYHGHDTYGLGVANALAAIEGGATAIDASFAGLGGCPFAPGAKGNVATEDEVGRASCKERGVREGYM